MLLFLYVLVRTCYLYRMIRLTIHVNFFLGIWTVIFSLFFFIYISIKRFFFIYCTALFFRSNWVPQMYGRIPFQRYDWPSSAIDNNQIVYFVYTQYRITSKTIKLSCGWRFSTTYNHTPNKKYHERCYAHYRQSVVKKSCVVYYIYCERRCDIILLPKQVYHTVRFWVLIVLLYSWSVLYHY